ncbi:DUF805 domain-containing protein [Hyphobacterium sp.]|uniref:DUF805 domain-containing protein n=1 Tax=Hyphobacterium sp. TaxID=2004662 RepID=UPI003BAB07EE
MDIAKLQNLLLTFEGRIGPTSLMQGTVAVFAVAIIIQLISIMLPFFGIIGLALLYPMFCLHAKRFHDGGKPAIWTLAVLGGILVGGFIISMILTPLLVGDMFAAAMRGEDVTGMGYRLKSFLVGIIVGAATYFGAAFVVNQVVKGDPADNAYGPPPTDAASPNPLG